MEITEAKQRRKTNEASLRDLCDHIKYTNIHITGVPGGEERETDRELFENIITQNFPILDIHISRSRKHKVLNRINSRRTIPRHTVIKRAKIKDKENIKSAWEKQHIPYKGIPIKLSANFSRDFSGEKEVAQYI